MDVQTNAFEWTALEGDDKLGFQTSAMPPGQVYISAVESESWAERNGIQIGMELFSISGCGVQDLTKDDYDVMLQQRPLKLCFGLGRASRKRSMNVRIQRVELLSGDSIFDKLDPYCILKLGEKKSQTPIMRNGGKSCVFDYEHEFSHDKEKQLEIVVMDHDRFSDDDLCGRGALKVSEISDDGFRGDMRLGRPSKYSKGEVGEEEAGKVILHIEWLYGSGPSRRKSKDRAILTAAEDHQPPRAAADLLLQLKMCLNTGMNGEHPPIWQGWLLKRGANADFKFEKRWCVVKYKKMDFYSDDKYTELKGHAVLHSKSSAMAFRKKGAPGDAAKHCKDHPQGFVLDAEGPAAGKDRRLLYFDAETKDDMEIWLTAISRSAFDSNLQHVQIPEQSQPLRRLQSNARAIHGNVNIGEDTTSVGWGQLIGKKIPLGESGDDWWEDMTSAVSGVMVRQSATYSQNEEGRDLHGLSGFTEVHPGVLPRGWVFVAWSGEVRKKEAVRVGAEKKFDLEVRWLDFQKYLVFMERLRANSKGGNEVIEDGDDGWSGRPSPSVQLFAQRCFNDAVNKRQKTGLDALAPSPNTGWDWASVPTSASPWVESNVIEDSAWPRYWELREVFDGEEYKKLEMSSVSDFEASCAYRTSLGIVNYNAELTEPACAELTEPAWTVFPLNVLADGTTKEADNHDFSYKRRVTKIATRLVELQEKRDELEAKRHRRGDSMVHAIHDARLTNFIEGFKCFIAAQRAASRELSTGQPEKTALKRNEPTPTTDGKEASKFEKVTKKTWADKAQRNKFLAKVLDFNKAKYNAIKELEEAAKSNAAPPPVTKDMYKAIAAAASYAPFPKSSKYVRLSLRSDPADFPKMCFHERVSKCARMMESQEFFLSKLGDRTEYNTFLTKRVKIESSTVVCNAVESWKDLRATAMALADPPLFLTNASLLYDVSKAPPSAQLVLMSRQCIKMTSNERIFHRCLDTWATWEEKVGDTDMVPELQNGSSSRPSISLRSIKPFFGVRLKDLQDLVENNREWMEETMVDAFSKKVRRKTMYEVCPELVIPSTVCQERIITLLEEDIDKLKSDEKGGILDSENDLTLKHGTSESVMLGGVEVPTGLTIHGKLCSGGPIRRKYWAAGSQRSKFWKTVASHNRDFSPLEDVAPIPEALQAAGDLGEHADRIWKASQLKAGDTIVLRRGVSYIDVCSGDGPKYPLDSFASHFWGEETVDFVRALTLHAEAVQGAESAANRSYYVCTMNNNQHRVELGSGWEDSPFNQALHYVANMSKMQPDVPRDAVMVFDMEAQTLKRKWCVFEAWRCTELDLGLYLFCADGEITPNSTSAVAKYVLKDVGEIDLAKAACSVKSDARMIDKAIEDSKGGRNAVVAKLRRRILNLISFMGSLAVSIDPLLGRKVEEVELRVTSAKDGSSMLTSDVARCLCSNNSKFGRRLLLVAPAGSGKSVFSRSLVRFAVDASKTSASGLLPIRVPLAELARVIEDMKRAAQRDLRRLETREQFLMFGLASSSKRASISKRGSVSKPEGSKRESVSKDSVMNKASSAECIAEERAKLTNLDFSGIFEEWAKRTFLKDAETVTSNKCERLLILDGFDEAADNRGTILAWLSTYLLKNPNLITLFTTRPSGLEAARESDIIRMVRTSSNQIVLSNSKNLPEGTIVSARIETEMVAEHAAASGKKKKKEVAEDAAASGKKTKKDLAISGTICNRITQMSTTLEAQYVQDALFEPLKVHTPCASRLPVAGEIVFRNTSNSSQMSLRNIQLLRVSRVVTTENNSTQVFTLNANEPDAEEETATLSELFHYQPVEVMKPRDLDNVNSILCLQPGIHRDIDLIQEPFEEWKGFALDLAPDDTKTKARQPGEWCKKKEDGYDAIVLRDGKCYYYPQSVRRCRSALIEDPTSTTWLYDRTLNGDGRGAKADIEIKDIATVTNIINEKKKVGRLTQSYAMSPSDVISVTVTNPGTGYTMNSSCRIPRGAIPLQKLEQLEAEFSEILMGIEMCTKYLQEGPAQGQDEKRRKEEELRTLKSKEATKKFTIEKMRDTILKEGLKVRGVCLVLDVMHTMTFIQLRDSSTLDQKAYNYVAVPKELEGAKLQVLGLRGRLVEEMGFAEFAIDKLDPETASSLIKGVGEGVGKGESGNDLAGVSSDILRNFKPADLWDRPLMANLFAQFLIAEGVKQAQAVTPSVAELTIFRFVTDRLIRQAGHVLAPDNSDDKVRQTTQTVRELLESLSRSKMNRGERLFSKRDFPAVLPIFDEATHGHLTLFEPQSGGQEIQFYHLRIQELLAAEQWGKTFDLNRAAILMAQKPQLLQTGLAPLRYLVQGLLAKQRDPQDLIIDFSKQRTKYVFQLAKTLGLWIPNDLRRFSFTLPSLENFPSSYIGKALPRNLRCLRLDLTRPRYALQQIQELGKEIPESLEEFIFIANGHDDLGVFKYLEESKDPKSVSGFGRLVGLKNLSISNRRRSTNSLKSTIKMGDAMKCLAKFPLRQLSLDTSGWSIDCSDSGWGLPKLEELTMRLHDCLKKKDQWISFSLGLSSFKCLRKLDLDLGDSGASGQLNGLGKLLPDTLLELSLQCNKVKDSDLSGMGLPKSLERVRLVFAYAAISDEGLAKFAEVGIPSAVQHLALGFNFCRPITDKGMMNFGKKWPAKLARLSFDISGCLKVGDEFLVSLGAGFSKTSLRHLAICVSGSMLITDNGAAGVCAALPSTLEELDLDFSGVKQISGKGLQGIGAGLPSSLEMLCLRFKRCPMIGDTGLSGLGGKLPSSLRQLSLQITQTAGITSTGLQQLGAGLPAKLANFQVDFSDCPNVGDDGLMGLSKNMPQPSQSQSALKSLSKQLPDPLEDIHLVFKRCKLITSEGLEKFRDRLVLTRFGMNITYASKTISGGNSIRVGDED